MKVKFRGPSPAWQRIAAKIFFRPSHLDRRGQGNARFAPWRGRQGEFHGYVSRESAETKTVVVFFHGKDGEALDGSWVAPILSRDQLLVLAEYPGYGARCGAPSQEAMFHAALETMAAVSQRWKLPTILLGESLGSSVACYVASHLNIERVGLISPFSSLSEVVRHRFPFLPVPTDWRHVFASATYANAMTAPLHIVHGEADRVVPMTLSRRLYEAYPQAKKAFTSIAHAGHVTIRQAVVAAAEAASFRHFIARADERDLLQLASCSVSPSRNSRTIFVSSSGKE